MEGGARRMRIFWTKRAFEIEVNKRVNKIEEEIQLNRKIRDMETKIDQLAFDLQCQKEGTANYTIQPFKGCD